MGSCLDLDLPRDDITASRALVGVELGQGLEFRNDAGKHHDGPAIRAIAGTGKVMGGKDS